MHWECSAVFTFKINILKILVVVKILHFKNSKIKRKNKEELEGVHDSASVFIEKQKQVVNR